DPRGRAEPVPRPDRRGVHRPGRRRPEPRGAHGHRGVRAGRPAPPAPLAGWFGGRRPGPDRVVRGPGRRAVPPVTAPEVYGDRRGPAELPPGQTRWPVAGLPRGPPTPARRPRRRAAGRAPRLFPRGAMFSAEPSQGSGPKGFLMRSSEPTTEIL